MAYLTRRELLAASGAPLLAPPARPNILLILTDQQTHTAVSALGNPYLKTPAMDSLVHGGVSFMQATCPYPVCSPSRAGIFSGLYPHQAEVMQNGLAMKPGIATLGEHFRQAGYRTVYGGKWHLYGKEKGVVRGFDLIAGETALGARMDSPLASKCGEWLRQASRDPFLMVASFMNPHDICQWIRDHKGSRTYRDVSLFPPAPANMAADPLEPEYMLHHRTSGYELMSQGVGIASRWTPDDFRLYLHDYYRLVEDVDRNIAGLLRALNESGLAQNTLVAFAADHGEGMGAHRWVQKAAFYEESVRVPLVFSAPFLPRRSQKDFSSLASLIDIFPTFCDFAGVAPPPGLSGLSLRAAIEAGQPVNRLFAVSEQGNFGAPDREGRMLRTLSHKYAVYNGGERPEMLFNLVNDPGETRNLARLEPASPLLRQCRTQLSAWARQHNDGFRFPASS
jgi:arylsulfatase A-like enzyme